MSARFEIVRTDTEQPWHARFIAANGEPVWSTENYMSRTAAVNAVNVVARAFGGFVSQPARRAVVVALACPDIEVRDVDERTVKP